MSTNIPGARDLIQSVRSELLKSELAVAFPEAILPLAEKLENALAMMKRQIVLRTIRGEHVEITQAHRDHIMTLSNTAELSCAEIAIRVFGRAEVSGRVSEILRGEL